MKTMVKRKTWILVVGGLLVLLCVWLTPDDVNKSDLLGIVIIASLIVAAVFGLFSLFRKRAAPRKRRA